MSYEGTSLPRDQHFASLEGEETARILLARANRWFINLDANGYMEKLREMWAAYHGAYYSSSSGGHRIMFSGEQGEVANIPVNHLRNIAQHILVMVTAVRPTMQARAINSDSKSLSQTRLANALLDYYMRDKRLEQYIKTAVEYAIVLGAGYVKMEWNATSGEIYDYEELEDGTKYPIYEGDVRFANLSPFDVVFDSSKEGPHHDWVLTRSFKNKWDLVAKYPEFKEDIIKLQTKSEMASSNFNSLGWDETDDVPVYEFYHKSSESMPNGRYLMFLAHDIVLSDGPMPYNTLPVFRIAPSDILGTPYGYTPMFDILPIQDALNAAYSTILSNQTAFGVQNVLMPRGSDINPRALSGGLNIIEYNPQFGPPQALNLTSTPPEVFKFLDMLVRDAETLSGVNSVSRGNPEASLKSGNALALVQSMALQYVSGLQQSYIQLIEDIGTGLINMLKSMASVPRLAIIAGRVNHSEMKEFTGDSIANINRVIVDVGNPLAYSTAGRVQMAEQLLQMGLIRTPEQYFMVMNTGQLEVMTEDTQHALLSIRRENEKLIEGEPVMAIATERHAMHIKEHQGVINDAELKMNPELVQRVLNHINEHITLLRTTDPDLLKLMGEQPLGPIGGSPANIQPDDANQQGLNGQTPGVMAQPQTEMQQPSSNVPSPAAPPKPFNNLPTQASQMVPR